MTDPDGNPVSIKIDSIFQDEPTDTKGDGDTDIDGNADADAPADSRGFVAADLDSATPLTRLGFDASS